MKLRNFSVSMFVLFAGVLSVFIMTDFIIAGSAAANPAIEDSIPVQGMVTMVDLGAKKCIPCKLMAPILADLKKEYDGKAAIIFVDVWQKENQAHAKRFKVRAIPTQIFFDKEGKEISRHVGFMDKKTIVVTLKKLGVK
ncbi:thioredoxin family protein [Desulfobacterales bacterium HSG16]|nr:thioredoxin family protein [Desulfobacterales bacterium HSG16]